MCSSKSFLVLVVLTYIVDSTVEATGGHGAGGLGGGRGASRGRGKAGAFSFGSQGTGFESHDGKPVGAFRVSGFGTYKSSLPAVSGNLISSTIFSRVSGGGEVIANPQMPIRVESMIYYWKPEYMPENGKKAVFLSNKEEMDVLIDEQNASCSSLDTSAEGYFIVCVVSAEEKMERCSRAISMLPEDRIRDVSFKNGSKHMFIGTNCSTSPERNGRSGRVSQGGKWR